MELLSVMEKGNEVVSEGSFVVDVFFGSLLVELSNSILDNSSAATI